MAEEGKEASPKSREPKEGEGEELDLFWEELGVRKISSLRLLHFERAFSMEASWVRDSLEFGVVMLVVEWRLDGGWRNAWRRAWARSVESLSLWMCEGWGFIGVSNRVSNCIDLSLLYWS